MLIDGASGAPAGALNIEEVYESFWCYAPCGFESHPGYQLFQQLTVSSFSSRPSFWGGFGAVQFTTSEPVSFRTRVRQPPISMTVCSGTPAGF